MWVRPFRDSFDLSVSPLLVQELRPGSAPGSPAYRAGASLTMLAKHQAETVRVARTTPSGATAFEAASHAIC